MRRCRHLGYAVGIVATLLGWVSLALAGTAAELMATSSVAPELSVLEGLADSGGAFVLAGVSLFLMYKLAIKWAADVKGFSEERQALLEHVLQVLAENSAAKATHTEAIDELVDELRRERRIGQAGVT